MSVKILRHLLNENKFVTNFKEKAKLFNSHLATQCSLISNNSKLSSHIQYLTDNCLSCVSFSHDKIAKVIQNLDPNKVHGHDSISICMLKVCGPSIYKPLEIIFNQCLETGVFPSERKKGNIALIHKKGDKQILKSYRPMSLLPICAKILKRLMFNEMLEFFIENKLISTSQSGFKLGNSCINQLLSITYEIYSYFDEGLEVRSVFLNISKTFDKVWHDGIIFRLIQNSISGNLLNLLRDFLNERKQRVVLNGQFFTWKNVSAGVP